MAEKEPVRIVDLSLQRQARVDRIAARVENRHELNALGVSDEYVDALHHGADEFQAEYEDIAGNPQLLEFMYREDERLVRQGDARKPIDRYRAIGDAIRQQLSKSREVREDDAQIASALQMGSEAEATSAVRALMGKPYSTVEAVAVSEDEIAETAKAIQMGTPEEAAAAVRKIRERATPLSAVGMAPEEDDYGAALEQMKRARHQGQ